MQGRSFRTVKMPPACDESRTPVAPAQSMVSAELSHTRAERTQIEQIAVPATLAHDAQAELAQIHDFFSRSSAHLTTCDTVQDELDALAPEALSGDARRGMYATLAILLSGTALIGSFLVYNKLLMPTPEEPSGGNVVLPTPAMLRAAPPLDEPERTISEAPRAASEATADEARQVQALATVAPSALANEPPAPSVEYRQALKKARALGFRRTAERAYLHAVALEPAHRSEALSGLAMLYLNQGKNLEARARAQQAVAIDGTSSEGWIVLAAALSALRDEAGAREAYQACAAFTPDKYVLECKRMLR